jgi:hypothetical protein
MKERSAEAWCSACIGKDSAKAVSYIRSCQSMSITEIWSVLTPMQANCRACFSPVTWSGLCNAEICCRCHVRVRAWQVTAEFNQINGLDLVCRAHQLVQEGLKYMFNGANIIPSWFAQSALCLPVLKCMWHKHVNARRARM